MQLSQLEKFDPTSKKIDYYHYQLSQMQEVEISQDHNGTIIYKIVDLMPVQEIEDQDFKALRKTIQNDNFQSLGFNYNMFSQKGIAPNYFLMIQLKKRLYEIAEKESRPLFYLEDGRIAAELKPRGFRLFDMS